MKKTKKMKKKKEVRGVEACDEFGYFVKLILAIWEIKIDQIEVLVAEAFVIYPSH